MCASRTRASTAPRDRERKAATKGAIVTVLKSLALMVGRNGWRVTGVAPGPVWTGLVPS
jgi:NAD(P)-dependent dehydrogenase (short-subunit alcohol dehydrogenase family)